MFFIRDCNDAIVGNPKGYPTFKGANIQANKQNAPAYRAIWSAYDTREMMYEQTEVVCDILPKDKPRYLMGVGTPENILECIALGVDMFDCVMPTRNARNGMLFTSEGILNMRNEKWKNDHSPIDPNLGGYSSTFYSKAYLRHLVVSKEILAAQIASIHNLTFYLWLVKEARKQIIAGTFVEWKNKMVKKVTQRL
jgi:queuine tRNA-ribosyltransferase